jgi:hypothetical protein
MATTLNPMPPDFWDKWHGEQQAGARVHAVDPRDHRNVDARDHRNQGGKPPRRSRPLRACANFLIVLGAGIVGTLAWQAYGHTARDMLANAYPQQLGWVAPPAEEPPAAAPTTVGSAAPMVSPDQQQQQLDAISLSLATLRTNLDRLAAQLATGQQQTAGDIARLQASEQDILSKIAAPPRPAPAPVRKPAPLPIAPAPAH